MTMLIPIRDENPYRRFPVVTLALIALNTWVFVRVGASQRVLQNAVIHYGAIPCDVVHRCSRISGALRQAFPGRSPVASVFTSMFMHGSWVHLGGNMLYLWVFGNNVEDRLGRIRYALFYFVCGVAAAFTHFAVSSSSQVPVVGASGAISGVLGAYFVLWPRARVLSLVPFLLFIPVEVSAGFLIGFWFVLQLLLAVGGLGATASRGNGVAFFAHVGGFVAGWLLVRVLAPPPARRDPASNWFRS